MDTCGAPEILSVAASEVAFCVRRICEMYAGVPLKRRSALCRYLSAFVHSFIHHGHNGLCHQLHRAAG